MSKKIFRDLSFWILFSLVLGMIVGAAMGKQAVIFAPLGQIFMQLIKMLVVPLVSFSIVAGAASLGTTRNAGKLGISAFLIYIFTTVIAVCIGIIFAEIFKPGLGIPVDQIKQWFVLPEESAGKGLVFNDIVLNLIPSNPIKAFTDGNILQILFFCLFFGVGVSFLPHGKRKMVVSACDTVTEVLIWMIRMVMYTAPIGVFGLMAEATGTFGFGMLALVLKLFFVYLGAILVHGILFYSVLLKGLSKMSIRRFFSAMVRPQLLAFSTASSMATLPVNMETCQTKLGVSKETTSFVLPLGATINMDGNAIYYAMVAVFFAQMFGIPLGFAAYSAIVLTATIGSIGQAGVPGPTLLVVAVLLAANVPIIGLPLLYALDRIFDMIRTVLNITGDACCAVIVDKYNTSVNTAD